MAASKSVVACPFASQPAMAEARCCSTVYNHTKRALRVRVIYGLYTKSVGDRSLVFEHLDGH